MCENLSARPAANSVASVHRRTLNGINLPLEVYLTQGSDGAALPMAWGLRCCTPIVEGQVIGVYLGLVGRASQLNNESEYQLSLSHFHDALPSCAGDGDLGKVRSALFARFEAACITYSVVRGHMGRLHRFGNLLSSGGAERWLVHARNVCERPGRSGALASLRRLPQHTTAVRFRKLTNLSARRLTCRAFRASQRRRTASRTHACPRQDPPSSSSDSVKPPRPC